MPGGSLTLQGTHVWVFTTAAPGHLHPRLSESLLACVTQAALRCSLNP